ncbi:hypothetical protein [Flavobacterium tegetincola]|uniref:DUF7793 family protein n=1 Tax=Flavobacterium tegetincola TaxID=150172 RepID=UPI00047D9446|nr:hypothetical protein [Flavobacterium tegetincola]
MIAAHRLYENKYAQFEVQDGILFITYKLNTTLNLEVAQRVVADRIRFQNNTNFLVLCDIRGIVHSDKRGRDFLAHSGSLLVKAVALLVHEKVLFGMSSFYLEVNKPAVPTEIFTDKIIAVDYLQRFL